MITLFLIIMIESIWLNTCQNLPQKKHRLLATQINCTSYSTAGQWPYIIYDGNFTCYDSNPDQNLHKYSGNLLLPGGQQINLASQQNLFECSLGCVACFGPTIADCIECESPSRGQKSYPTVATIIQKTKMECSCRQGYQDQGSGHCKCPDGRYEVGKTEIDVLWDCLECPFIYKTCMFNSGNSQIYPLTCKTGVGRSTDPNLKCACITGYSENKQMVSVDCVPDCEKPCSQCQPGSSKLCSQCFDGIMILNSTTFTCTCPISYYMDSTDFRCYACHYTCQTCNGATGANCQSCITTSLRLLQSGYCICPQHYVISSQLNCVQCDWSCDTCYSTSSCQSCMPNDNRVKGASGFCVCKDGYAEDLVSSVCVQCQYTCLTCEYQFDSCASCPSNSFRQLINSQCKCQDYYYDGGDLVCQQCDFTCKQCDGPLNDNCINCDIQSNRYLNNQKQCSCIVGYGYVDQQTLECQLCNFSCLTCDQIDQCLTCHQNAFRILDDYNKCVCDVGYYEHLSQLQCLQCHYTCQTCDGQGPDRCLSCNYDLGRELNISQCQCSSGFYEFYKICTPCFYTCLQCINQFQDGCTVCPQSRQLYNGQCVCKSLAQIDDGKSLECSDCHYTCQTCYGINSNNCLTCYDNSSNQITTSRQIKYGICNCPQNWYDDGQNEQCQQCHYSCNNCFDSSDQGCITCSELDFRTQRSNSCYCMDGYFEVQQSSCSKCDYRCETCISDKTNCLTCPTGSLRIIITQNNSSGYFTCACTPAQPNDVQDNPICQPCHFSCSNCTQPLSNFCTICSDAYNRYLITDTNGSYCYCKNSYYEIGNSECASCSSICFNCKTIATNCTECDPNIFRVLSGNTCICATRFGTKQLSYYDNLLDPECVACHYSCYTCYGAEYTQCSTCSDLDFRYQQGSECLCKPKYIDNGEAQCMTCNYSCDTCEGTKYNCTSCPSGSLRTLNVQSLSCQCPSGYYDAGITNCQKCDIICDSCSDQATTCLSCVIGSNRVYNQLTYYCDCLSGYYDAGDGTCSICHLTCSQCTGPLDTDCTQCPDFQATKRVLLTNSCICADQYYDNQANKICQICSSTCYTCQGSKNTCTQCLNSQNRILSGTSCVCLSKYYDSGSDVCQKCSEYCLECQNISTQCTQCDSNLNRYLKQQKCQCQDGYYDNQQLQCEKCNDKCKTCINDSTCITCDQNDHRELQNGQCICMYGSIELGNKQCGICDSRCSTCNNLATECLSCDSSQYRILVGKQCVCIQGYFENSLLQCQPCNQQCYTCINNEYTCTTCRSIDHIVIGNSNTCICQNGYYTDLNNDCQICSNQCLQCLGSANYCTSCNIMRILVNNSCQCLDGQYNSMTGCIYCSYTCQTCSISAVNCTSCSQSSNRIQLGSQCLCLPGYYEIGTQICQKCGIKCLTCINSTQCQTCDLTQFRIQNGTQCPCKQGYYDDGSALCQPCDKQCETCIEQSNKCTSCNIGNTFRVDKSNTFNQCPCNVGFYDDQDKICKKCQYQCLNCVGQSTNCTVCNINPGYYRINILPSCNCQDGYFDDGIQVICQKCNFKCQTCILQSDNCLQCENPLSRNTSPVCDCTQGYYLEVKSLKCLECSMQCQTCSDNANNCKSCKPDRITQKCLCQEGYYEANLQNCQLCSPKCKTCENHELNCQSCALNRINPPNCICKEHYYDDQINIECQECDQYCGQCDFNGCIDCAANRVLSGKNCICPVDSISYTDTPWCSNCDVAVVQGIFSDDLTSILYKFEFPIQFYFPFQINAQEYCEKIIMQESLKLLGQSPQCSTHGQNLIIQLGDGSTVLVNDTINFNPVFLKHQQCSNLLTKILRTEINLPLKLIKPSIELEYPKIPISPCSQNQININKQFISGERNLIIKWSSSIMLKEISQANFDQFQTLTIEQGSLPENSIISITLQFTNFLGQSDKLSINITTLSSNIPQFQFQGSKQQYLVWAPIKIMVYYSNKICSQSQIKQVINNIEINFKEVEMLRQPIESNPVKFTQELFHTNDSENILYTIIPANTLSIKSNYYIQASYIDSINNIYLTIQKNIQIKRSPLLVQIVGGSRIQNYLKDFTVQVLAKDPDFQTEWNTDQDITVEVSCVDIQRNNQPCQDVFQKKININSTSFTQYIGKRLFNPFTVIVFKAVCKKQNLISTEEVSIILLDTDLPSLDVKYPIGYKIRDVNINEQLQFEIQLANNQFLKNMQFSYALVYNYETVFVKFIPNQNLKFKMWDNFVDFGFVNKISVRLQAHDINYLMPQTFSVQLSINLPPVMSIVSIQPQIGNSFFTQYSMKVQNAKDADSPISYRFAYYQSEQLQNIDIIKGKEDNLITIQDFSLSQTFNGILESGNLKILISVSDSYGSTKNYSQQITSLSFFQQIQQKNVSCSEFLLQLNDSGYDYNQQIILAQELIKLNNQTQDCLIQTKALLSKLKQSLEIEMQSQTNINNQFRINNILSQLYDIDYSNERRILQNQSENICYEINSGEIRFNTLKQINHQQESQQLIAILDSLYTQIQKATTQNMNLLSVYQSSIDIGDEFAYRTLQQNFMLRQSFIRVLGSLYQQADQSRFTIRNLINKLLDSFQKTLELDKSGIKLVTNSIGVQTYKISQIQYQQFVMADQDGDEIQDLSTYQITRIVQMSRYQDNFYFSQQSFYDQFKNGTYMISEIDNNNSYKSKSVIPLQSQVVYDPFIYVDRGNDNIQVIKIYSGKLNFNMKQELDQCNNTQQNNQSNHKYSFVCSTYDVEWKFNQCQLDLQINKKGQVVIFCLCKMMNPITLMILNETKLNKTNTTQINRKINIQDYVDISLRINTFNIIILSILTILIIIIKIYPFINRITQTSNVMIELERLSSEQTIILTQQPQYSKELFKKNLKYLHEISRLVTTRYTYISQPARIMLIMFNIYIPLSTLNVSVAIFEQYFISLALSLIVGVIFQILTKIVEGFFTGPKALRIIGYIFIIILNLGLLIVNSIISNTNHHLIKDVVSGTIILIIMYGPIEILIQYIRLKLGFQIYKQLNEDPMNPILNFIYYFFQDEILICIVKGANIN